MPGGRRSGHSGRCCGGTGKNETGMPAFRVRAGGQATTLLPRSPITIAADAQSLGTPLSHKTLEPKFTVSGHAPLTVMHAQLCPQRTPP